MGLFDNEKEVNGRRGLFSGLKNIDIYFMLFILVAITAGTLFFMTFWVDKNSHYLKNNILSTTYVAANALDGHLVSQLTGTAADMERPAFKELFTKLMKMKEKTPQFQWFYLMSTNNGKIVFMMDASPPEASDFAVPGTIYQDAPQELKQVFFDGQSKVAGPYNDKWGFFISAFVPIPGIPGKERVVLGLDVFAKDYYGDLLRVVVPSFIVFLLFIIGVFLVFSGLARLRRISKQVIESERRYRLLVENTSDILFAFDKKGVFTFISSSVRKIGYEPEEIVGTSMMGYIHPDDAGRVFESFQAAVKDGIEKPLSFKVRAKDQSYFIFEEVGSVIRDDKAIPIMVTGILRDMTMRVRAEQSIREYELKLAAVIDAIPNPIFYKDTDGRYENCNQAFVDLIGVSREKIIGSTAFDIFSPDLAEVYHKADLDLLSTNQKQVYESKVKDKDGLLRDVIFYKSLVLKGDGSVRGMVGVILDITNRKEAEDMLNQARESAEEANRAKSTFLANMSHEIRTPLNGIVGMTELALGTDLTATQRRYLDSVLSSARALLDIINDILDISRIEAGRMNIESVSFMLEPVLEASIAPLQLAAQEKNLELICDPDPEMPGTVIGDPVRLRQILVNLLGNAVKFTETGHVVLHAGYYDGRFRFTVSDTGIGVPPEKLEQIFNGFTQADGTTVRKYGGSGLGLTISRELVQLMGGEIRCESKVGEGSHFIFEVPLKIVPNNVALIPPGIFLVQPMRSVLVVDDNPEVLNVMAKLLSRWGVHVESYLSGRAGLKALETSKNEKEYDAVIVDLQMPDVDGVAFLESLGMKRNMNAVLMVSSRDVARYASPLASVPFRILVKPILARNLRSMMDEIFHPEKYIVLEKRTHSSVKKSRGSTQPLHVLITEDNEVNRSILKELLNKRGIRTSEARNGGEAIKIFKEGKFDLLLMDLHMPIMDGFAAVAEIREIESESGHRVPIIALTADALVGDREKCLSGGMDDYLAKPFLAHELFTLIEKYLPSFENETEPTKESVLLAKSIVCSQMGLTEDYYDKTLVTFLQLMHEKLIDLRKAATQEDATQVRDIAHSMKSSAGFMGAEKLQSAARELENQLWEHRSVNLFSVVEELAELFAEVEAEVAHR